MTLSYYNVIDPGWLDVKRAERRPDDHARRDERFGEEKGKTQR